MFTISSNFIGSFKTGDNINNNLRTLALLYERFSTLPEYEKKIICKPIILILASITEAILHDFHLRIRTYTIEGVANLTSDAIGYIRGGKFDEFKKYIASAKRHDFFESIDTDFYDSLDTIRKLRNRIHIQNTQHELEENESAVFTVERKELAEKVLEKVLKTMLSKYPRPSRFTGSVADFQLPWNEHFPNLPI